MIGWFCPATLPPPEKKLFKIHLVFNQSFIFDLDILFFVFCFVNICCVFLGACLIFFGWLDCIQLIYYGHDKFNFPIVTCQSEISKWTFKTLVLRQFYLAL